ncbi:hypothetical protein AMTR_s00067p00190420 [Amborella trichopoda]|uniref:Uncharacterized protein n=1 Tax=Amborella trichopoda TaxID=13333 RepID=U5D001_AMBTC|nr:hypothetical protein AMTR_s00067p00190420 [Amborella trichopoda]
MGYSMIGSRGKFYGDNAAHRIYTNGAHQADYNGAPGSSGDLGSQNPMIGSNGDLNPVIPLFENGSVKAEFVQGGSFGFPRNDSLDDICSGMLYDQDEDFKIM